MCERSERTQATQRNGVGLNELLARHLSAFPWGEAHGSQAEDLIALHFGSDENKRIGHRSPSPGEAARFHAVPRGNLLSPKTANKTQDFLSANA